jgi:hypothetical protein
MRAERDTAAAVNTNKGLVRVVKIDGVYRTGFGTVSAADAQFLLHDDAPAFALHIGPGRAGFGAGSRIAKETSSCLKSRGQTARGENPYARRIPRQTLVNDPGAGQ